MSRDDSFMYTGLNSTSAEPRTPREVQKEEKEKAYYKLKPGAQILLDLLEKERNSLYDFRTFITDSSISELEVKVERLARQRHDALIKKLEGQIKQIMKAKS